jgi:hypothetical protein
MSAQTVLERKRGSKAKGRHERKRRQKEKK